jgi:hypothetical protein
MDPVKLVLGHRQELGLHPYFIGWLRRETGYETADQSVVMLWIVSGALFLGSNGICPNLSMSHERLPRTETAPRKRTPGIRGLVWEEYVSCWSGFPLQGVHRFESSRLLDMSNRLFVTVIA